MENLNAEQITNPNNKLYDYVKRIIEAVKYKGEGDHEDVPSILRKFAKGYEQRIKELTEENERLKSENAKYEAEKHAEFNKWLKLEEATKRRHSELFEEAKIAVKEDTVRKIQERLKNESDIFNFDAPYGCSFKIIDQIAKEIMEGL